MEKHKNNILFRSSFQAAFFVVTLPVKRFRSISQSIEVQRSGMKNMT